MLAVRFYDVALWAHISCIIIAFGVTFAYPILVPSFVRNSPRSAPALFAAMDLIGKRIIAPFGGLALLFGAYMATDADLWGESWVVVPLVILVLLLAAGGMYFSPAESKISALMERDIAAAGTGEVTWAADTQALMRQQAMVGALGSFLVLIAAYFMTVKPFA